MVARPEQAEQAHGQGVGARRDLRAHDGGLGPEQLRVQALQRVAALVVIAVAVGRVEVAEGYLLLREQIQHAGRQALLAGLQGGEPVLQGAFAFRNENRRILHVSHIYHTLIMIILKSHIFRHIRGSGCHA